MKHLIWLFFAASSFSAKAQYTLTPVSEEYIFENPPFEICEAATLAETAPNKLMISFYGCSPEKNKEQSIWMVKQMSKKWTRPYRIAGPQTGDSVPLACWNPVLFRAGNGKMFLFYKVGNGPKDWRGMVRTSDKNGNKWNSAEQLPEGIAGPFKNRPVQLHDGVILCPSTLATADNKWRIYIERSADMGKT